MVTYQIAYEVGLAVYLINLLYGFKKTTRLAEKRREKEIDFRSKALRLIKPSRRNPERKKNITHERTNDSNSFSRKIKAVNLHTRICDVNRNRRVKLIFIRLIILRHYQSREKLTHNPSATGG